MQHHCHPSHLVSVVLGHNLSYRSGTPLDPACDASAHKLSTTAQHYLIIDTNVALHQVGASAGTGVHPRVVGQSVAGRSGS